MKDNIVYSEFVDQLAKPAEKIIDDISPTQMHCLHMVVGICTEAGELLSTIKKASIYNQPIDIVNVIEELGDIEFYMQGLRNEFGLDSSNIIRENIIKLSARYPDGYTDDAAATRADKQDGE